MTPSEAAGKVNAVTGNLPPVAPEVIAAAEAETDAYLTHKGFPGRECLTLTAMYKTGGVMFLAGDAVARYMTIPAH